MKAPSIAWRRASRGILFIGFGVFFFLGTQGMLHRGFWLDALTFWPVCLIAMGIRIIFERSKAPALILLSPVVILGTLSFVAWRGASELSAEWAAIRAEGPEGLEEWTLEARGGLVDIDLGARPLSDGLLLEGRKAPANRGSLGVSDRGDTARVYLRGGRRDWHFVSTVPRWRQRWDFDVTDELPLRLQLETAFAQGELDLGSVRVTRVDVDGAFNNLTLRLGEPERETRVYLKGGFNRLELLVPDSTPVRHTTDGFINWIDGRSNRSRSGPAYLLRSDGAFNRVVIRSADGRYR